MKIGPGAWGLVGKGKPCRDVLRSCMLPLSLPVLPFLLSWPHHIDPFHASNGDFDGQKLCDTWSFSPPPVPSGILWQRQKCLPSTKGTLGVAGKRLIWGAVGKYIRQLEIKSKAVPNLRRPCFSELWATVLWMASAEVCESLKKSHYLEISRPFLSFSWE